MEFKELIEARLWNEALPSFNVASTANASALVAVKPPRKPVVEVVKVL